MLSSGSNLYICNTKCSPARIKKIITATKKKILHPELKEEDIKLFCYIQAGFTPTMMSVLLRKAKSVVYNRMSRLRLKLSRYRAKTSLEADLSDSVKLPSQIVKH